jgi:transposase-like protein
MSKSTISTFQLFEMFPDQETAREYLESRLWPNGAVCPVCVSGERITTRRGGYYRCNACREDFTVRTGTIFERSHVPLHKWLYAMYLLVTARKGISSLQLAKEIGVTQKSAWFLLHRLREACGKDLRKLRGIIEVDETFVGGKERNKMTKPKIAVEQWRTALENIISMVGQSTPKPQCVDLLGVVNVARTALSVTCPPEATCNSCTHLRVALSELLAVIAADDLIPESVSYMRQARAALAPGEPALTDRVACCGRLPHGRT